jgi:hypothetical protein
LTRLVTFSDGFTSSSAPTTPADSYQSPSNWPTLRPSLLLDFANGRTLDPKISFSRSSTATRLNERGILETVPANYPRFDHDPSSLKCKGLLLEESQVNHAPTTEDFTSASWSKIGGTDCTITANSAVAPDGTTTMDKIEEATTNSSSRGFQMTTPATFTAGASVIGSIFVQDINRRYVRLQVIDGTTPANYFYVQADLTNGTFQTVTSGSGTISSYGLITYPDGRKRLYVIGITGPSDTRPKLVFYLANSQSGSVVYTGTVGASVYVWGANLVPGTYLTSYIPNSGTGTASRSADSATISGTSFTPWYRSDEGTFVAEAEVLTTSATSVIASVNDNTANNRIELQVVSPGNTRLTVIASASTQATTSSSAATVGAPFVLGAAYDTNDFSSVADGGSASTDSSGTIPTVDRLFLGRTGAGTNYSLHLYSLKYYPKRLTNAELQAVTSV